VFLQDVEDGSVIGGDSGYALGQQMGAQFVGDGFADQPQGIFGEPAVRGLGLIQFQLMFEQVAQAIQQFALQGAFGCDQCAGGVAAECLGNRGAVGLDDTPACSY